MKNVPIILTLLFACACYKPAEDENTVAQSYVHEYGFAMAEKEWKARGKNGKVVTRLKTGEEQTANYHEGKLHGLATMTFPYSEHIALTRAYEHGNLIFERRHYMSGRPMQEERFLPDGSNQMTTWYEDGTPKSVERFKGEELLSGEYYSPKNEIESRIASGNGEQKIRDGQGQLKSENRFEAGKLIAKTEYFPSGDLRETAQFTNGQLTGERKIFSEGGVPQLVEQWKLGKLNGPTLVFQDAELVAEVPYVEGLKEGIEKRYVNSRLVEEILWRHDRRHGPSIVYADGEMNAEYYYHGKPVSKFIFDQMVINK